MGGASLVWTGSNCTGWPVGTHVWGRDDESGLDRVTVECSPATEYNLRWTEPGRLYAGIVPMVPPKDTTCTLTLYDRAGNFKRQTLYNPGPKKIPGCDHSDDNHSAASVDLSSIEFLALPEGSRSMPRVAILDSGFAGNMLKLLFDLGEPSVVIESDFDPIATAAQYPVLVIPSGGLYGMENSASFRARLEEYARLGGTVVAFDQQHGYEYGALPGGEVGGYGWNEDVSCSGASLMMETWHPLLSGLNRADVYAHVDGYFDSWPEDAQIILSRKANGRPAAILYPYPPPSQGGAGGGSGWVFATTMYDDWGSGHGQSYDDARVILRDLLTWAIREGEVGWEIPRLAPGDPLTLTIPIANTTPYTATTASLRFVDPSRQIALTHTVAVDIPPGTVGSVPFTTTASTPLGIWRVEAGLSLGSYPLTGKQQVARYVVAQPPAIVDPARPLYLSITSSDDTFVIGNMATFIYHVYNYGATPLTATVHYGFNHDFDWYGTYRVLAEDVVIPPAVGETPGELALPLDVQVQGNVMVRGHVVAGDYRTYAGFGVRTSAASAWLAASAAPAQVQRGQATVLTIRVTPAWVPVSLGGGYCTCRVGVFSGTLHVRAVDGARTLYYTTTLPVAALGQSVEITHPITVPASVGGGSGYVWIEARSPDGRTVGGAVAHLSVPASPLAFSLLQPPPLAVEGAVPISVAVTNTSPSLAVESGVLTLTLTTPGGGVTPTATTAFTLAPSSSDVLVLPLTAPPLEFGAYTLAVQTSDEYGTRRDEAVWHTTPLVEGVLDQPTARARAVARLDLTLANPGPLVLPLTATLAADLPYSHTQTLILQPYETLTVSIPVPIPPDVAAGSYPLTLTLTLPGGPSTPLGAGDTLVRVLAVVEVPPSDLDISTDAPSSPAPGQTILVTLANTGGADTTADYDLRLVDARGRAVVSATASAYAIQAGGSIAAPLTLPEGVASGHYTLLGAATDLTTGERATLFTVIDVEGLEASLDVSTDQLAYLTSDPLTMTAAFTNGVRALSGGALALRVTQPAGVYRPLEPEFISYTTASTDSGLGVGRINAIAVDKEGNVWFATEPYWDDDLGEEVGGGVSVLLADGTWNTYTVANSGLGSDYVYAVAVDEAGNTWFAVEEGVSVHLADGTWTTYTTASTDSGLGSDYVYAIAVDEAGNAWFATEPDWDDDLGEEVGGGVSVLLTDGTWITYTVANSGLGSDYVYAIAVDKESNVWFATEPYWDDDLGEEVGGGVSVLLADGTWTTYTTASTDSGLGSDYVYAIAVDKEGNAWFAVEEGVSVLLADGTWTTYTTDNSGLGSDYVRAIAVDEEGNAWFATEPFWDDDLGEEVGGGVSVLLADGSWRQYDASDGLGSDDVTAIAVAPDGTRWVATYPNPDLGQPGGVTAIRGPLAVLSPWQSYTAPFEELGSGYYFQGVDQVAADPAGNRWFLATWGGEGCMAYLFRLPADESAWQSFEAPLCEASDMAVDGAGTVWLATWGGVQALDAHGDWTPYTVESTEGGILSDQVTAIAVDAEDRVWFATEGGGVSVLSGTTWITYTAGKSGLPSDWVRDVVVDDAGNAWFVMGPPQWEGSGEGVSVRLASGAWITYTMANSPLPSDDVRAIAVDDAGNAWFATAPYWDEELEEEVGGSLTLRRADGTWAVYTDADGLPTGEIYRIAVARDGTVWLACGVEYEGGIFTFSPDTGEVVQHTIASTYGGLVSNSAVTMAVDGLGDVWIVGGEYYDEDLGEWVDGVGVSRYTGLTRVLWQATVPVDLAGEAALTEAVAIPASALGVTGRMTLEGELQTAGGQRLALDRQPFTVYAASAPALSLGVSPTVAAPGESVTLEGGLYNGNALPLAGQAITVTLGGRVVAILDTPTIPAGDTWSTTVAAAAPSSEGPAWAEATDGTRVARDRFTVSAPALDVALEAPDVAGREPFDLVLVLKNPSLHDLDVDVAIVPSAPSSVSSVQSVDIPAGETRVLVEPYAISADTIFTATISGDVSYTLHHTITFGEAAVMNFAPQPVYAEGAVAVPYTIENTGLLPVEFTTAITIQSSISILQSPLFTYLSSGEGISGDLLLDLPPGDYTLTFATPFESGAVTFRVARAFDAALSATAGPVAGSVAPITAVITNTGIMSIDGVLRVESAFFTTEQSVSLTPTLPHSYTLAIDLTTASSGTHPITLTLLAGNGSPLASTTVDVTAPGAELVITSVPTDTVVQAGEWVTLTFGVENAGSAPATAIISATVGDLLDEAQSVWLPGGESGTVSFVFRAPDGLSVDSLLCTYWFEGQRADFVLSVASVALDVQATWDQDAYFPGDTATLQVSVSNVGAAPTPPMYAHVAYQGQVITQPLTLAGGESRTLDFDLTAAEGDQANSQSSIVFYALYEAGEERGVYLNTTYLTLRYPDVTLVLDDHVYEPGDTVHVTVHADISGTLNVSAPGFTTTLQLPASCPLPPASCFSFTVPDDLARGTYTVDYTLLPPGGGEPEGGQRSAPFDVDAPWVRATEARLIGMPYMPGDDVQIDLTIASTHDLDASLRAWLVYPDGTRNEGITETVSLQDALNNHVTLTLPLSTTQSGPHRLVYLITSASDAEYVYAAGSETFDVGNVAILGVRTDYETYAHITDPVTASLTVFATAPTGANLTLLVDDVPVVNATLALTVGVQTIVVPVPGPMAPDWHDLAARVEAGGLSHEAHTTFAYGTAAVDLVVGSPYLAPTGDVTRTLRVWVTNAGETDAAATTVQIWDGDPGSGGVLLGSGPVSALAAGESAQVDLVWDVLGQAGSHTLVAVVDPDDAVAEFYEHNNVATGEVVVPPFELSAESDAAVYGEGDSVLIDVRLVNLSPDPATVVVTTTVESTLYQTVFTDVHALHASGAAYANLAVTWDTSHAANGAYTIHVAGENGLSTVPLIVSVDNVPPSVDAGPDQPAERGAVVQFAGAFVDPGLSDTHTILWEFGDGATAGGALSPTHVYTATGTYTVTLTVTDGDGGVGSDELLVTVSEGVGGDLICPSLAGPVTYVDSGFAPPCIGVSADPGTLKLVDSHCNPIADARVNLRKADGGYITYKKTDADGVVDFGDYGGSAVPSLFEVDYHGGKVATAAGSYDTGAVVQTREYRLEFIGSDCAPIENARVNLRKANDGYVTYVKTDADGVASFEVVPDAEMKLEVDYLGAKWLSEANTANVDVVLGAEAFRLRLIDSGGGPIENARVNLRKANDGYVTYVKTDGDGWASFDVVTGGELKLEVDYHGATYATDPSTSHAPETVQTKAFSLRVTDSVGQPIEDARVNLRKADDGYVTYVKTDADGVASFEVVPGAQMKLEMDYHGATYVTPVTTVVDDTQLEVQTRGLAMRVTDSTGQFIEDARVNLRNATGGYVTYTKTDSASIAFFEVVPGAEMRLELDYHGATYVIEPVVVDGYVEILVQTKAFGLRLIDSVGQPIEDARVNLRKANDGYVTYAKTDADGIAFFEVVPGAQMKLEVDYHGGKYTTAVTTIDADTQLEVQTVPLTVHVTAGGTDLVDQRIDLLKADGGYVTYAKTGTDGRVTFEILPDAQHKVRCTYDGDTWVSDEMAGPVAVEHDFD
jgi:ligand-binding sensor domain-containing protein/PKD repeat protein